MVHWIYIGGAGITAATFGGLIMAAAYQEWRGFFEGFFGMLFLEAALSIVGTLIYFGLKDVG